MSTAGEWIRMSWDIHTLKYYSDIKRNACESALMRWVNLEPIIRREVRKTKVNIIH